MSKVYKTKEEVLSRAREAIGLKITDIISKGDNKSEQIKNRLSSGKGAIGNIVEESWFGLTVNNNPNPDFEEAGVELKVPPYIITTKDNIIRAKERLVCNIINFMEEDLSDFYKSSFWKKCNTMLLMPYEYKKDKEKGDYTIDNAVLFSFPEEDLLIIKHDWEKIMKKIRDGKAEEISEGDTMYLGACTKGATAEKSLREQPYSNKMAKQRAYSLKKSYMDYVFQNYIFGNKKDPQIVKDPSKLKTQSFEEYVISLFSPYIGKTQSQLKDLLQINSKSKQINSLIVSKILGEDISLDKTAEFKKANITPKTILVKENGTIKENMSLPPSCFANMWNEEWEESTFREYITQAKFFFVVFQRDRNHEPVLKGAKFWNIPAKDLKEVEKVWKKTKETILQGVEIKQINGRNKNNLPKSKENPVCHVRPHGEDGKDYIILPDGQNIVKQCFWLKNSYIKSQIQDICDK